MQIYLSGSSEEEPTHHLKIRRKKAEPDARRQSGASWPAFDADLLRVGRLSPGMAVSHSSCSRAVVAGHRFTSTSMRDSESKLLMRRCLAQTCRAAVVAVDEQLQSVDSVREAVALSRQQM